MTSLGREQLNEYLEKPLELEANQLSTAVSLSATSLSTGGLSGEFVIRDKGNLVIKDGGGVVIEDGGFLRMFDEDGNLGVSLEFE